MNSGIKRNESMKLSAYCSINSDYGSTKSNNKNKRFVNEK